ncbi:hypothetical protein F8S13_01710 [Chloroflexia bacterium SDU3-3]|nr:hypothetical protein F8S13_01710 [Chloroflexia bacterium SDU3-3]
MICQKCHAILPLDALFCHTCGSAVRPAAIGPTQRLPDPPAATGPTQRLPSPPSATPLRDRLLPTPPPGQSSIRQGICPRCHADTIYTDGAWHNRQPQQIWIAAETLGKITHFICRSCGYMESYILDDDARAAIERYWLRLDPSLLTIAQIEDQVRELVRSGLVGTAVSYVQRYLGMSAERAEEYVRSFQ